MEDPAGQGEHLVGDGSEGGGENGQEGVLFVLALHEEEILRGEPRHVPEEEVGHPLPEPVAQGVAADAAQHRARRGQQSEAEAAPGPPQRQRHQQRVGRNRKENRLAEGQPAQRRRPPPGLRPGESPVIQPTEETKEATALVGQRGVGGSGGRIHSIGAVPDRKAGPYSSWVKV